METPVNPKGKTGSF